MKINTVELTISATRRSQYPESKLPEFLLVGRSNVGKSSFINTIIHRKNYARTSARPGKTQTINFYLVNDEFYLVDAPGYGYASVSKEKKAKFGLMIEDYLSSRKNLERVFMLIDFRHKPSEDDELMYAYLKHYNIPVTLVATKLDKVKKSQIDKNIKVILDTIQLVTGDNLIIFSSVTKDGKNEIQNTIEGINVY